MAVRWGGGFHSCTLCLHMCPRDGHVWGTGPCPGSLAPRPAQVWDTAAALNRTAEPSLQSLERQLAARPEPLRAVRRLQGLLDTLLGYTAAIPFWRNPAVSLEALAEQVDLYDWYRCGWPSVLSPHLAPTARVSVSLHGLMDFRAQCLSFYGWEFPRSSLIRIDANPYILELPVDAPLGPRLSSHPIPVCPQVAGLLGPAAARRGHLPAGAGRPHPQLQGHSGWVSLWGRGQRAGGWYLQHHLLSPTPICGSSHRPARGWGFHGGSPLQHFWCPCGGHIRPVCPWLPLGSSPTEPAYCNP